LLIFVKQVEREEILEYFFARFGIAAEAFGGLCFVKKDRTVWIVPDHPGLEDTVEGLKIKAPGIPILRVKTSRWKPTTTGLQFLGGAATRNRVDLEGEALDAFLKEGTVNRSFSLDPGYVIVRWNGQVLGCGLYTKGCLRCQIPEARLGRLKVNGAIPEP
jgi:NOL1/NOP2/fmu family ribosome biogenesis protein